MNWTSGEGAGAEGAKEVGTDWKSRGVVEKQGRYGPRLRKDQEGK